MSDRVSMRPILVAALVLFSPGVIGAQIIPTGWTPSAADCQKAADSLTAGSRNADTWGYVSSNACRTVGPTAIATAIRNVRVGSVADTLYLSNLFTVAGDVQVLSVLDEAITLAESKPAPVAARAFGLMLMLNHHRYSTDIMGDRGWNGLLADRGPRCQLDWMAHGGYSTAEPMPSDFRQRIAGSADRIAADAADSPVMRHLASCVRLTLRRDVPEVIAAELLQLEYVCGSEFRVRNSGAKTARLRFEVEGTADTGDLVVPGNGSAEFLTRTVGTVRLLQNGVLVRSLANPGTVCP